MKRIISLPLLFYLLINFHSYSQDFSGSFIIQDFDSEILLKLSQDSDGNVTGTMSSEGEKYDVTGHIINRKVNGYLESYGESAKFTAMFVRGSLEVTFFDPEFERAEQDEFAETWNFEPVEEKTAMNKSGRKPSGKHKSKSGNDDNGVKINNITLTDRQIDEIEEMYAVKPLPGNYWYDSNSGLYGVKGYPAYGFMYAGHDFGDLDADASNGDTGVFVNSRELPQLEWMVWSQLLGYYIQPGRYWLDENGDAGYEGYPIATDNLYLAAQRNSYGSSGGGDNIWSSRFGAGNYDQGNQRGYVSVPGYGPIGYGF